MRNKLDFGMLKPIMASRSRGSILLERKSVV